MSALTPLLRRRMALDGPMTVAQYMAEALYHPKLGYYAQREPLGAGGDFITAPEISQMFGELIGLWCAQCWLQLDRPAPLRLIELGPGRGTLMVDALRAGATLPGFREALVVHLVEISPSLRETQRAALAPVEVHWHDNLSDVPEGPALIVANEFFDSLPIRQFERSPRGWHERLVDWDEAAGRFRFVVSAQLDPAALLIPAPLRAAAPGSIAEVCPAGLSIAAELGQRVAASGGAALIVDYGPAEPSVGPSFQAVRRHRQADPLADPGNNDLSAHVDFASLAAAAREAGAAAHGPVPQGAWLNRLGLPERARRLKDSATPDQRSAIDLAGHRLTAGEQMGMLFKVLALASPRLGVPPGFAEPLR